MKGSKDNYRVFRLDLTSFEDLGGQLKTIFWSKRRYYLCIPEVWAFEFHQPVLEKVRNIGWPPQQPSSERVLYVSEKLELVILVPVIIRPSGLGSFLRK